MSVLFYQTIELVKRPRVRPRAGARVVLEPPGPDIRLSPPSAVALELWGISQRVNYELGILSARIGVAIPPGGGVLVAVAYHEEREPDPSGENKRQHFLSLDILGSGRVPQLVVFIHKADERRVKGAPKGWMGKTVLMWVTR